MAPGGFICLVERRRQNSFHHGLRQSRVNNASLQVDVVVQYCRRICGYGERCMLLHLQDQEAGASVAHLDERIAPVEAKLEKLRSGTGQWFQKLSVNA